MSSIRSKIIGYLHSEVGTELLGDVGLGKVQCSQSKRFFLAFQRNWLAPPVPTSRFTFCNALTLTIRGNDPDFLALQALTQGLLEQDDKAKPLLSRAANQQGFLCRRQRSVSIQFSIVPLTFHRRSF